MSAAAVEEGQVYKPFPTVPEWTAAGALPTDSVDELRVVVDGLQELPREVCAKAVAAIRDAAAIETGAIENLYELDRGVTITAATEGAILETVLAKQTEKVRALIESQLRAYDFVLDFVTKRQLIAEAWIRDLHAQLCSAQTHYGARNILGEDVQRPLQHGQYKAEPNHVVTRSGNVHLYASVEETVPEMGRLVETLQSDAFTTLHPVDQVAYAHYGLVTIHPFSDGNGRMARALASVFSYRAYRVPLLITVDQRTAYFDALEAADAGDFLLFRRFVRDRIADSILLLSESVRNARLGTPLDGVQQVRRVFETKGGYSHVEVDRAGFQLLKELEKGIKEEIERTEIRTDGLHWSVSASDGTRRDLDDKKYRRPISASSLMVHLRAQMMTPADAVGDVIVGVAVPRDAIDTDAFVLECGSMHPDLSLIVPVRSVLPTRVLTTDIAVKMFARRIIARLAQVVAEAGYKSLKNKGY
jgi:Fic family protein